MEEDLVSIALEAAIGGSCGNFKVSLIKDRVFSFCVANKNVGFHILKLRRFCCQQFKCYFYLRGRGGPNWQWEFSNWKKQCDDDWILVSPSNITVQKGLKALQKKAHHSILSKVHNVNKKLQFADSIAYDACLGYKPPSLSTTFEKGECSSTPSSMGNISDKNLQPSVGSMEEAQKDFENLIDDMAFKVWKCGRCLSLKHESKDCTFDIRCRSCFNYGHIRKNCLNRNMHKVWVPKDKSVARIVINDQRESVSNAGSHPTTPASFNSSCLSSSKGSLSSPRENHTSSAAPSPPAPSVSAMAVFEVDPTPWLPWGHQIIDGGPMRLPRTYYNAAQDPPPQRRSFCVAMVDAPPPPHAAAHWRHQVNEFLVGP
jgi:hypothetical protein